MLRSAREAFAQARINGREARRLCGIGRGADPAITQLHTELQVPLAEIDGLSDDALELADGLGRGEEAAARPGSRSAAGPLPPPAARRSAPGMHRTSATDTWISPSCWTISARTAWAPWPTAKLRQVPVARAGAGPRHPSASSAVAGRTADGEVTRRASPKATSARIWRHAPHRRHGHVPGCSRVHRLAFTDDLHLIVNHAHAPLEQLTLFCRVSLLAVSPGTSASTERPPPHC